MMPYDAECDLCGFTKKIEFEDDFKENFIECHACGFAYCRNCGFVKEDWHGTGWSICDKEECQSWAVEELMTELREKENQIKTFKEIVKDVNETLDLMHRICTGKATPQGD